MVNLSPVSERIISFEDIVTELSISAFEEIEIESSEI